MKKTLYFYLMKEQLGPLAVCLAGLLVALILGRMSQLTLYLFMSSITVWDIAQMIGLIIPHIALYALPMACLIGVLMAFVRLSSDNELIALRCAGIGFQQLAPAVLSVVILTTGASYYNSIVLLPAANQAFAVKLRSLGRAIVPALLKEGVFIDVIPNMVFFFNRVNPSDQAIEGVFIQDSRKDGVTINIVARQAAIFDQAQHDRILLNISDGSITSVRKNFEQAQVVHFQSYDLAFPLSTLLAESEGKRRRAEMSLSELWERYQQTGNPRSGLEVHQRLALPLACLLLGCIAAPLGASFQRGGKLSAVVMGLTIFLVYYLLYAAGNGLGENGLVPPGIAMWLPNILGLALTLFLWWKVQREAHFRLPGLRQLWRGKRSAARSVQIATKTRKLRK